MITLVNWMWWRVQDPGWLIMELIFWLSLGVAGLIVGAVGALVTVRVIRTAAITPLGTVSGFGAPSPNG